MKMAADENPNSHISLFSGLSPDCLPVQLILGFAMERAQKGRFGTS